MTVFTNINYKETHFETPELKKIHGEPTYESLELLIKQLKANARSVHSNLGGGQHGHLGLVISPTTYNHISAVPFTKPLFPGAQALIPPGATQHLTRTLRIQFEEDLRVYHEVENVDKALKKQLVAAVESKYLDAIRNRTTDTITDPVYRVMEHLFSNYGDVTPETLQQREAIVKAIEYDPTTPIDNLFKEIDDLVDLSGRANIPMTPEQSITIAYVILWRTQVLKEYLKTWNSKAPADKTWDAFKTHFRDAVKEWKQLRGPVVQDSIFGQQQHANLLQQLRDDVRTVIAEEIQHHSAHLATNTAPMYNSPYVDSAYHHPSDGYSEHFQQMINAMTEYQHIIPTLVNQVKQLQQVIQDMKASQRLGNGAPPSHITPSTDTSTITSITFSHPNNYIFRPPFHLYCHTHGLCAHTGK